MIRESDRPGKSIAGDNGEILAQLLGIRAGLVLISVRLQVAYGIGRRSVARRAGRLLWLLDRLLAKLDHLTDPPGGPGTDRCQALSFDEHRQAGKLLNQWRGQLVDLTLRLNRHMRSSHPIARRVHLILIALDDVRWALDTNLARESTLQEWADLQLDQIYLPFISSTIKE